MIARAIALSAFVFGGGAAHAEPASKVEISIVGTSDLHGRIAELPLLGGYLAALRGARPGRVVLIDAGDVFQGTLESNLEEGAVVVSAYRLLGYDAVAIGNHEFDYGPVGPAATARKDALGPDGEPRGAIKTRALEAKGAFPFLAANILEAGKVLAWDNVAPSRIVKLSAGIQVGIIGVTTEATPRTTLSANFIGLEMESASVAVRREAEKLRKAGVAIVVVAAHLGGNCAKFGAPKDLSSCKQDEEVMQLANSLPRGLVDVIVGGHTHAAMAQEVNGIQIVQSWSYGRAFGRVDLTWDLAKRAVVAQKIFAPTTLDKSEWVTYEGRPVRRSEEIERLVIPAIERSRARREAKLGVTLAEAIVRSYDEESPLGNWFTSLMLRANPSADIALQNGGGLRANLPKGALTYGALYDAFPFDNLFALVKMTGAELKAVIRTNLQGGHGVFSIAGAHVVARCKKQFLEIELVRAQDRARKPSKRKKIGDKETLLVATNDFLATGGDNFGRAEHVVVDDRRPPIREEVAEEIARGEKKIRAADWLGARRMKFPGKRPVRCGAK